MSAGQEIIRPSGRPYRPRKITAHAVTDPDDELCGVMVLGTQDSGQAQPLADHYAAGQLGSGYVAADPVTGWWRDGISGGSRCWVNDPEYGRAGVWFRSVAEAGTP